MFSLAAIEFYIATESTGFKPFSTYCSYYPSRTYIRERVVQISNYNLFSLAAMELPQINYREYNGKKYSFVYGVSGADILLEASVCLMQIKKCTYPLPG